MTKKEAWAIITRHGFEMRYDAHQTIVTIGRHEWTLAHTRKPARKREKEYQDFIKRIAKEVEQWRP